MSDGNGKFILGEVVLKTPEVEKYCQVNGIVTWVDKFKYNGGWVNPDFIIETCESHKRFYCSGYDGQGYCNISAEDLIEAEGWYTPSDKDNVDFNLRLDKVPLIEPAVSKTAILKTIHHSFPRQGKLMLGDAERLYNKLADITSELPEYAGMEPQFRINLYMTKISNEYHKMGSESTAPDIFYPEMEKKNAIKLLRDWYKNRVVRQLKMLGLVDEDIRESYYDPTILYTKLRNNPFTIPFITLEKAESISRRFRLGITNNQYKCGDIVRQIYKNTKDKQWCGTPTFIIKKTFPDFDKYRECLTAETDEEAETPYGWDIRIVEVAGLELVCLRICNEAEVIVKDYFIKMVNEYNKYCPGMMDIVYKMKTLTDEQKLAINGALNNPISCIVAGAGFGKSTLAVEIINNLHLRKINVIVVGYTGKSVFRIKQCLKLANVSENIIENTYTLHGAIHRGTKYADEDVNAVLCDEATMADTRIFSLFLSKFTNIRRICFFGDLNQLLPIGWGTLFAEVIESERFPIYRLSVCHRTIKVKDEVDGIYLNCNAIANHPDPKIPFRFKTMENEKGVKNFFTYDGDIGTVKGIIEAYKKAGILDYQFVVICPYNIVKNELNRYYQEKYRVGCKDYYDAKKIAYRVGDIVIMRENNYDINVMNGQDGRVLAANDRYITISFDPDCLVWDGVSDINARRYKCTHNFMLNYALEDGFGNNYRRKYNKDRTEGDSSELTTKMICLGYARTAHLSQGSEFMYTLCYIPPDKKASRSFLCRNILYTMVSRARRACYVVGNIDEIERIVSFQPSRRYDLLSSYLVDSLDKSKDGCDGRSLVVGTFISEESKEAYEYFTGDMDDDDDWE